MHTVKTKNKKQKTKQNKTKQQQKNNSRLEQPLLHVFKFHHPECKAGASGTACTPLFLREKKWRRLVSNLRARHGVAFATRGV